MEQLTVGQQFWKKGYRKSLTQFRNFEPKNIHQKFQRIIYNPTLTEGEKIFSRFWTFSIFLENILEHGNWLETFKGIKSNLLFIKNYLFRQLK